MSGTVGDAGPIVVIGDLMVDVAATATVPIVRGSDAPAEVRSRGGGSGANVAAWLAQDGVPVVLVTRVGDDAAGRADVAVLQAAGVDVRAQVDPARPTGTCVTIVEPDGERTFLPDRGANVALDPAELPRDAFVPGGHLHLSGYVLLDPTAAHPARAAGIAALRLAKAVGMTVSVDPASSGPLHAAGPQVFLDWVAGADILLPNLPELVTLTGETDPDRGAQLLRVAGWVKEVVVTLGAGGALYRDGERTVRADAPPVPAGGVVDSTGAGDAFAAAWLALRRAGGSPEEALAAACARGSRVVGVAGARPAHGLDAPG
jgi:ribokinase